MRFQPFATALSVASAALAAPADTVAGESASSAADLDWAAAYTKANAALAKLSSNDKINLVTGVGWSKGPCVGNTAAVSSIGYPQFCIQDGPLGVRYGKSVNAFTPGIQAASTWDRTLIRERGTFMGQETKGCGIHVLLGPVAGPLGKNPAGGRNWEGFGADPYLQGIAMAETIEGLQAPGCRRTRSTSFSTSRSSTATP